MPTRLRPVVFYAALSPLLLYVAIWAFGQAQVDWRYKLAGTADPFLGHPAPEVSVILGLILTAVVGTVAWVMIRTVAREPGLPAGTGARWWWVALLLAGWGGYFTGSATEIAWKGPVDYRASLHLDFGAPLGSQVDVPGTCRSVVEQPELIARVFPGVQGLPSIYLRDLLFGAPPGASSSMPIVTWQNDGPALRASGLFVPPNVPARPLPYLQEVRYDGVVIGTQDPISFVTAYNYEPTRVTESGMSGSVGLRGVRFADDQAGWWRWVNLTIPNDPWPASYQLTVSWKCEART